jgi:hypothetical protein
MFKSLIMIWRKREINIAYTIDFLIHHRLDNLPSVFPSGEGMTALTMVRFVLAIELVATQKTASMKWSQTTGGDSNQSRDG